MTIRILLYYLPKNSKRMLEYLEYSAETNNMTQTGLGRELSLNKRQTIYAMKFLRNGNLVIETPALGKMSTINISVNTDIVTRSDIKEMIHNV